MALIQFHVLNDYIFILFPFVKPLDKIDTPHFLSL